MENKNSSITLNGCLALIIGASIGVIIILSGHWFGGVIMGVTGAISQVVSNQDRDKENCKIMEEKRKRDLEEAERRKEKEESEREDRNAKYGEVSYEWHPKWSNAVLIEVYESSKVVYMKYNGQEWLFNFSDIVKVDIYEDGRISSSTTSTKGDSKAKTSSMLGRAVVGGVLLGGAGAVIGGTTGKRNISESSTTSTKESVSYSMVITINDLSMPYIEIKAEKGYEKDFIRKVSSILSIIMERKDDAIDNHGKIQVSHKGNDFREINNEILASLRGAGSGGNVECMTKVRELYIDNIEKDGSNIMEYLENLVKSDDGILSDEDKQFLLNAFAMSKKFGI